MYSLDKKLFAMIRKLNGLSQAQMAARLQVSTSLITKIETGERKCLPKLSEKVTQEFGAEHVRKVAELA